MYNWSAKQQLFFLKTAGVTLTIGVPYMQYHMKKWLSSTGGISSIKD